MTEAEIRIGRRAYRLEMHPEAEGEQQGFRWPGERQGLRWSAANGRVNGWTWGTRAEAEREAREALLNFIRGGIQC